MHHHQRKRLLDKKNETLIKETVKDSKETLNANIPKIIANDLMIINTSPNKSELTTVKNKFLDIYQQINTKHKIYELDLTTANLPVYSAKHVQSKFASFQNKDPKKDHKDWIVTQNLIEQFKASKRYVFLVPQWNRGVPFYLHQYFDHIVQDKLTFDPSKTVGSNGLIKERPCLIIASSGYDAFDKKEYLTSYIKRILFFIGFTDIRFVYLEKTHINSEYPEQTNKLLEYARNFEFLPNIKLDDFKPLGNIPKPVKITRINNEQKVLVITSSPMGGSSASNIAVSKFMEEYTKKYKEDMIASMDVANNRPPDFNNIRSEARNKLWKGEEFTEEERTQWKVTNDIIEQFVDADLYVIGIPFWNFNMPNQLKLYFDHVIQPNLTFDINNKQGLLQNKHCVVFAASGGSEFGGNWDVLSSQLIEMLQLVGITKVNFHGINKLRDPKTAEKNLTEIVNESLKWI